MEVTIKNVPANSTITIITSDGNCIKPPIQVRARPKKFKTTYSGSKVIRFTLDGVTYSNTISQSSLKRLLLDSVRDEKRIPMWLRKGTSSDATYRFVSNNK